MKKIVFILVCVTLSLIFSACNRKPALNSVQITGMKGKTEEETKNTDIQSEGVMETEHADTENADTETIVSSEETGNVTENSKRYIELLVNKNIYKIELYDTQAANALYEQLPITLTFEDFNRVEKIGYLSESLPTDHEPDGCDPDVGDLCLYAPWGNLSIFYKDFRYSDSLIMLGHLENGIEELGNIDEDFEVTIRVAE